MTTAALPLWRDLVLKRLTDRDARERDAFVTLIAAHNLAVQNVASLQNDLHALSLAAKNGQGSPGSAEHGNHGELAGQVANLETQIKELKDERADLYKTQGQNAQKMLELMEAMQKADGSVSALEEANRAVTTNLNTVSARLRDVQELIKEKDHVIQILKDELATHQLELVQREEQLSEKEKRVKSLEAENGTLIERWIVLKQEQAARMNEANEYVEIALKSKAASPRQLSSADMKFDAFPAALPTVTNHIPAKLVRRMQAHDSEINCVQINGDGSIVATGSNDRKVLLFDVKTGALKSTLSGATQAIMSLTFDNSGELVMGTSNDNSVKLWNVATARLKHTLTGHIGKVFAAKFTDSGRVISGSHDRTIKIWDLNRGFCTSTIFTLSSCNDLCLLNGDGTTIASGHLDHNVRIWDSRSGSLIRELSGIHYGQVTSVAIHPTENVLLTTSRDNTLKLIDLNTYQVLKTISNDAFRPGMNWSRSCFSPDGRHIASGSQDGAVFIWHSDGRIEKVLKEHRSAVCGVAWNSKAFVSAEKDRAVIWWGP
ncbi:WD40-repeat-containing domain protein [Fimicolochytrium jonesii]|uniref:WD40-repeat-containing domain protein n=1 Tax=Fimicolochytrium jonesii TaxID=1396493 RepID=UPI0022FE62D9|nr:WD40-repeat-containing domain protein [Fimicolochytrium jonesii]KAI8815594.1 WD40-repeat-containing domain protein [Fimicolochytrium jonesii]